MVVSMDALESDKSVPVEMPLEMEIQDFSCVPKRTRASIKGRVVSIHGFLTFLARFTTFGGATALTAYATYQMVMIVSLASVTGFQWAMVAMFTITFAWISVAACSAVSGIFFCKSRYISKKSSPINSRTVLLMPVYNENPASSFSSLAAMAQELATKDLADRFEIFVISDTNTPDSWLKETAAILELRKLIAGVMPVWYRRRENNAGKKAGNVEDFVKRWGGRYDFMLVLDADSIMSANALETLVREMEADPRCGILQTLPKLYGAETLFARMQQFSSYVYGGAVARGITSWQGEDGNYWGHNALIRVEAFAAAAGLPTLSGRKPFGGPIMSHDFVEAALIRRSGWTVRMLPGLTGSWEQGPPSLNEVAVRDRRWAQGNLQHLAVVPTKGLYWSNRAHMIIGIMSYLASPLWLALVTVGLLTYFHARSASFDYFKEEFSLFPTWPIFDSERMVQLFILTMAVLVLPKVIGILGVVARLMFRRPWRIFTLTLGVLLETILSILYSPIFMLIHTKQIFEILRGKDSGWHSQQRKGLSANLNILIQRHSWHTCIGVALTIVLFYSSLPLLAWMAPILLGLVVSIPLAALSSDRFTASLLRKLGILSTPDEINFAQVIKMRLAYEEKLAEVIEPVSISSILFDREQCQRHFSLVTQGSRRERGQPDIAAVMAKLKIEDGKNVNEVLAWLDSKELMALFSRWDICDAMLTLGEREKTFSDRTKNFPFARHASSEAISEPIKEKSFV